MSNTINSLVFRASRLAACAAFLVLAGCGGAEEEAAENFKRAQEHEREGDLRAAVIELKNTLKSDPDHVAARLLLGRTYLAVGNGSAAQKELEKARSLGHSGDDLDLGLAEALLMQSRFDDALAAVSADPAPETAAVWATVKGEALLGLQRTEEAHAALARAIEQDPDSARARRAMARLDIAAGRTDEAAEQIERALETRPDDAATWALKGELELNLRRLEAAEASFSRALAIDTSHAVARLGLAQALLGLEKTDQAATEIDALVARAPKDPRVNYLRALLARQRSDLTATQAALHEVLAVAPAHAPSLLLLGQVHLLGRELEQSEDMLRRHLASQPRSQSGMKLLAAVLLERRRYDEALRLLHDVEEQTTEDDVQVLSMLGTAYMALGQPDKSRTYLDRAAGQAPKAAPIRTQRAVSALAAGAEDEAIAELEAVIEASPEFSRADVILVLTQIRAGNFAKAVEAANHLAEKRSDSPEAQNLLAAALESDGKLPEARAAYARALGLKPDFAPAALNLARLDLREGKLEQASAAYEKVLERLPDNETALIALAKIASDQDRTEDSIALLEKARANNPTSVNPRIILAGYYLRQQRARDALTAAEEAMAAAPENPAVALLLGRAQLATGQARAAVTTLEALAESRADVPEVHFNLGLAQGQVGEIEAARASLERVLELRPEHLPTQMALGTMAVRTGQLEAALERAAKLQEAQPEMAGGYTLEGDALMAGNKASEAVATYQRAFELAQTSSNLLKLNQARRGAGDESGAEQAIDAWLEAHPDDNVVLLTRASRSHTVDSAASKDDALRDYEAVLERQPDNVLALNNLAWLYYERNDPRALELAKRAYDRMPQRPEIADTYGWLLVENGQVERGLNLLEKAVKSAPGNGDMRYHLAASLTKAGEKERAAEVLTELLGSDLEFSERESARTLLDAL